MRVTECPKCKKEQEFLTRVWNDSTYQYTYEEGRRCGHQVGLNRKPLPPGFKANEIRRKAGRRKG